jgi:hypothetical protein
MEHNGDEIVRLAYASNPTEAFVWQQSLEAEGITSRVDGNFLDAGIGDVGAMRPELLVFAKDVERARAWLEAHHKDHLKDQETDAG